MLREVNERDRDDVSNIVRLHSMFHYQGHACLVFERLGDSLYSFMKSNRYRPFLFGTIVSVAEQLVRAIAFLHEMNVVHADLKMENILLVRGTFDVIQIDAALTGARKKSSSSTTSSYRLLKDSRAKIIDFGNAEHLRKDSRRHGIVQTRQYRAPEVIVAVGWSKKVDVWSVGCIVMEMFLGDLLFATHDNQEHLALMERCVGPFPKRWRTKCVDFFESDTGRLRFHGDRRVNRSSRDHVLKMLPLSRLIRAQFESPWSKTHDGDVEDDVKSSFAGLMKALLTPDPVSRSNARNALNHPLFTRRSEGAGESAK
eukprot:g3686.t1